MACLALALNRSRSSIPQMAMHSCVQVRPSSAPLPPPPQLPPHLRPYARRASTCNILKAHPSSIDVSVSRIQGSASIAVCLLIRTPSVHRVSTGTAAIRLPRLIRRCGNRHARPGHLSTTLLGHSTHCASCHQRDLLGLAACLRLFRQPFLSYLESAVLQLLSLLSRDGKGWGSGGGGGGGGG